MTSPFALELLAAARPRPLEQNPFLRRLHGGEIDRLTLCRYACGLYSLAESFPRVLCGVLAVCDHPAIRASLLGNLLEEEGVVAIEADHSVRIDPSRRHSTLARRFAASVGASEAEIEASRSSLPRWFTEALAAGDWIAPLSSVAVGVEASVPHTFGPLIPRLREQYGCTRHDLEFLIEHVSADLRHGEEMAELIAGTLRTPDERRRALTGARTGGLTWWHFHRQFA